MKFAKDSPEFKMFQQFWSLIQSYETPKIIDDVQKIKKNMEEWALTLPKEIQIFAICIAAGYTRYLDYGLELKDGAYLYRNDKGHIAIKGEKR